MNHSFVRDHDDHGSYSWAPYCCEYMDVGVNNEPSRISSEVSNGHGNGGNGVANGGDKPQPVVEEECDTSIFGSASEHLRDLRSRNREKYRGCENRNARELVDSLVEAENLTETHVLECLKKAEINLVPLVKAARSVKDRRPDLYEIYSVLIPLSAQVKKNKQACIKNDINTGSLRSRFFKSNRENSMKCVKGFGASPAPPDGNFVLKSSQICRGGDLREIYEKLKNRKSASSCAEQLSFFNCFIYDIARNLYYPSCWHKLTVRDRFRKNENVLIDRNTIVGFVRSVLTNAKMTLEDGFDENVTNMMKVALVNFRRNMKTKHWPRQEDSDVQALA